MQTQGSSEYGPRPLTRREILDARRAKRSLAVPTRRSLLDEYRAKRRFNRKFIAALCVIALTGGGALFARETIAKPFTVHQQSMMPTLHDGDVILANTGAGMKRGDIIIAHAWTGDSLYIKRVIGIPGDNIEYRDGILWRNGVQTPERWESEDNYQITVPDGKLWVLGDNRRNSMDSRENGLLPIDEVIGVAYMRFLPFDRFALSIE